MDRRPGQVVAPAAAQRRHLRGASAHPNRPRRQGAARAGKPASPQRAGPGVGLLGREVAAPAGRSRAARPSAGPASGHRHGHLAGTIGATRSGTHGTGRPRRTRGGGGGRLSDLGSQQPRDARARRDGTTGCQPGDAIAACRPLGGDTRRRPIKFTEVALEASARGCGVALAAAALACDLLGWTLVRGAKWVWWNSSPDANLLPPSSATGREGLPHLEGEPWHVLRWHRRSAP